MQDAPTDIIKLLEERIKMYETAESIAKSAGESGRARRFNRGLKTIKDLLKQAKAGKVINNDDIPPEVSTGVRQPQPANDTVVITPTRPAPVPPIENTVPDDEPKAPQAPTENIPATPDNSDLLNLLNTRKNEYKIAAVTAKKSGDKDTAIAFLKITKQFEGVIKAVESGQPVDVSNMPGPPPIAPPVETPPTEEQTQSHGTPSVEPDEGIEETEEKLITAGSISEALQQRLEVYKSQENAAKEQGNSSKARRMGRIIKQYEQAIKQEKAGKPIPFDELPTPPGYAPFPVTKTESESKPESESESTSSEPAAPSVSPKKAPPSRQNTIRISGTVIT